MKDNIYKMQNPVDMYYSDTFPKQNQPYPGLQKKMQPVPDCGEHSYVGTGRLKGRKALVTGGDSGIGRAAAIAYAREGADIAINYLPAEEDDAQQVKELLEKEGCKIFLLPGDLKKEVFCNEMVKKANEQLQGIDILALVAGRQIATKGIENITNDQLYDTFAVNVFSLFWTIKAALPYLPKGASIITTASKEAFDPSEHLLDYASTKGAIKAFTQSLSKQLAPKGIRVNSVAPGPIWTALEISGGQLNDKIPAFGQSTSLKRAGQPVELAGTYVFLASQESSFITAEIIGVTGGSAMQ